MSKLQGARAACFCVAMLGTNMSVVAADVVVTPVENTAALANPLGGFRGLACADGLDGMGPYPMLTEERDRSFWSLYENVESDGIDKIRAYFDDIWRDFPARNVKAVFRVMLTCPGCGEVPSGFPSDIGGDWNPEFWPRLMRLIERLGIVFDNDPRVGYIESGFAGSWGEGWFEGQQAIEFKSAMNKAFKDKLIMKREAGTYEPCSWGMYWDSFAHPDQMDRPSHWLSLVDTAGAPRWHTAVMGGETAYDWGNFLAGLGANPTATMSSAAYYNRIVNCVRLVHSNHLGGVSRYEFDNPATEIGAALVQKALGYNFIIDTLTYPPTVQAGQSFTVSFAVRNTGSSPFYYRWPVQINLLNKTTQQPVWSEIFDATDVTEWLPGSDWTMPDRSDAEFATLTGHFYQTPAERYYETGAFAIPSSVPNGEYVLALAVLDREGGMLPSLRFAINNYWQGGYHPMGIIGVGSVPASTAIDPSTFFTSIRDTTLYYIVPGLDNTPPSSPTDLSGQGTSQSTINLTWGAATDAESGIREYSVYRDGVKVATAMGTSYTDLDLSSLTAYSYQVSAVNNQLLEGPKHAAITVTTMGDIIPPTISYVAAAGTTTQVRVAFGEPVEQSSAQNAENYAVDNGISISAATLGPDLSTVTLTVSTLTNGTTYTLTVNNIRDRAAAPNMIAANTTAQFQYSDLIAKIRYYPRQGLGTRMAGGIFEGTNGDKDSGPYTTLHTIGSGPGDQWTDVTSFANPDIGYRYVRYRSPDFGACNVGEIEFYRGVLKAAGTPFGTPGSWGDSGNDFTKAFDGDIATFFDAPIDVGAYCGLDLSNDATVPQRPRLAGRDAGKAGLRFLPYSVIAVPPGRFALACVNAAGATVLRKSGVGPETCNLSSVAVGVHSIIVTMDDRTIVRKFVNVK